MPDFRLLLRIRLYLCSSGILHWVISRKSADLIDNTSVDISYIKSGRDETAIGKICTERGYVDVTGMADQSVLNIHMWVTCIS